MNVRVPAAFVASLASGARTSDSIDPGAGRRIDRLAVASIAVAAVVALATFRDYGLGWDDYAHAEYGELLFQFYASGFSDKRALSYINLYMYGGGFDLLAALAAKILPFTLFETRRLVGAVVGLVGLIAAWRTGRRIGGPLAGLLTLVLLACCPLYVGHSFMNAKDAPFAAAMALLLLGLVRALETYPRLPFATGALTGGGLGLAIGSRIIGGFGGLTALAALALMFATDAGVAGFRTALARLGRFTLALLPWLVLAYGVMVLVWPWAVTAPLNPLRALVYFSRFFEEPWSELFGGQVIRVSDMPRGYVPTLLALQMPTIFFVLAVGGTCGALVAAASRAVPPNRRAMLFAVTLAALLPIVAAVLMRPAMYNGIRHLLFVLPPLAILGGLAGAWLATKLLHAGRVAVIAGTLVFAVGIALPVADMSRLHPYEYTYFNRLEGGVRAARAQYMLDYWALSFKQASQGLRAKLAELKLTHPAHRRWKLALCGPHRSPQVELGADFETTGEPRGADFAMMLDEYYCAHFDAPVLVEVVRAGTLYARVYDIRDRSYRSVLAMPDE
jgi:hypothetical protein